MVIKSIAQILSTRQVGNFHLNTLEEPFPCVQCRNRLGRVFDVCKAGGHEDQCFALELASEATLKAYAKC